MFGKKSYITVKEASQLLQVTPARIYQLISENKLNLYKNKRNRYLLELEDVKSLNDPVRV